MAKWWSGFILVAVALGLFFIIRQSKPRDPLFSDFSRGEQEYFLSTVKGYFRDRGINAVLINGEVHVGSFRLGLMNIAQICKQHPRSQWSGLIEEHFSRFADTETMLARTVQNRVDFSEAVDKLRVCLYHPDYLAVSRGQIMHRLDLPGTITGLALDYPQMVGAVNSGEISSWGRTADELFELGLANVLKHSKLTVEVIEPWQGQKLFCVSDSELYASAHALLLEKHPGWIGAKGALVAVPLRNSLLCLPLNDAHALSFLDKFARMAMLTKKQGPYSLNSSVYWYHEGAFMELPYVVNGDIVEFQTAEALERLTQLLKES